MPFLCRRKPSATRNSGAVFLHKPSIRRRQDQQRLVRIEPATSFVCGPNSTTAGSSRYPKNHRNEKAPQRACFATTFLGDGDHRISRTKRLIYPQRDGHGVEGIPNGHSRRHFPKDLRYEFKQECTLSHCGIRVSQDLWDFLSIAREHVSRETV